MSVTLFLPSLLFSISLFLPLLLQASPDWASLPTVPLDVILTRLVQKLDYLRFSSVCKSWHSAALNQKNLRRHNDQSVHVPMLLTPPLNIRRRLYCVARKKLLVWNDLNMPLPSFFWGKFCGSAFGWLGVELGGSSSNFMIFNPFSGDSFQIPAVLDTKDRNVRWVHHMVWSRDPSLSNGEADLIIGVLFGWAYKFAYYIKAGGESTRTDRWTVIEEGRYCNLVYHGDRFYLVADLCSVFSIEVNEQQPVVKMLLPANDDGYYGDSESFLVTTGAGDLLMVRTRLELPGPEFADFQIFKLLRELEDSESLIKVGIDNLGSEALFLSNSHSSCVSASQGCRPNCIYYILGSLPGRMNVYSLDDKSFKSLDGIETEVANRVSKSPATWIVPTVRSS